MYGSLTALIMVMLWLYICMNLLLYGAEINAYFEKQFRMAQASMREMLSRERDEAEKELNKEKKKYLEKENGRKKKTEMKVSAEKKKEEQQEEQQTN